MNLFEMYILLFIDTLVSNFAFNISTELAIHSMKIFGLYNTYLVILVASLGFMLAACINYGLGILCYNILSPLKFKETNTTSINTDQMRRNKYLPLFLILSALPFYGKFIMLFAGFCKVRPMLTISIGSISRLIYYSLFMIM